LEAPAFSGPPKVLKKVEKKWEKDPKKENAFSEIAAF